MDLRLFFLGVGLYRATIASIRFAISPVRIYTLSSQPSFFSSISVFSSANLPFFTFQLCFSTLPPPRVSFPPCFFTFQLCFSTFPLPRVSSLPPRVSSPLCFFIFQLCFSTLPPPRVSSPLCFFIFQLCFSTVPPLRVSSERYFLTG